MYGFKGERGYLRVLSELASCKHIQYQKTIKLSLHSRAQLFIRPPCYREGVFQNLVSPNPRGAQASLSSYFLDEQFMRRENDLSVLPYLKGIRVLQVIMIKAIIINITVSCHFPSTRVNLFS